ncbi:DUF6074 family protein [Mesorhizobium sp.]|uniref:DUF6074 family protein n=1 Tax=Mesorhizobium sp. TaxID=1871066 RepID=UPI000FE4A122|nr:DUF6074 family protein [Mesorhizobium sp.]RWC38329.1 MAG: hypothetical protein EOS28_30255 [Mesorhizobium sp.]RWF04511.1 MAG: hypothetical protein EOS68_02595 [Mesorhizobium sp.]
MAHIAATIPFPLTRRVGKIRDVATKMMAKSTDRHAESYRDQVTVALLSHLTRIGVPQADQDKQLSTFWAAVQTEVIRQSYRQQA